MKLLGKYKAIVGNTKHPDGQVMAQVKLVTLWDSVPEEQLPWAEYLLALGAAFSPSKTGDLVWVEFPQDGDTRYPLIIGACMVAPGGTPNIPPEASGKGDAFTQKNVSGAPALPAITPTADSVSRRNGLLEQRTQKGGLMFTHMKSGSRFGFNDEGEIFFYSAGVMHFYADHMAFETAKGIKMTSGAEFALTSGAAWTLKGKTVSITASQVAVKKG